MGTRSGSKQQEHLMTLVRFGFHMNISNGLANVPDKALELECNTIQIFSRNPRGWDYKPLAPEDVMAFKEKMEKTGIRPLVIHMPYLPNPASADKEKAKKSLDSLIEELNRAEILNAPYVNIHIGKSMESPQVEALNLVVRSLNTALERTRSDVMVLLENTAGQGTEIGYKFDQIKTILDRVRNKKRIGVCLDTAHLFGAGYDLRDQDKTDATFRLFDQIIGLEHLHLIHFNDSKAKFNSRTDRHEHIGKGEIGIKGMRSILHCGLINHLPFILETPKDSPLDDLMNLKTVKKLLKN